MSDEQAEIISEEYLMVRLTRGLGSPRDIPGAIVAATRLPAACPFPPADLRIAADAYIRGLKDAAAAGLLHNCLHKPHRASTAIALIATHSVWPRTLNPTIGGSLAKVTADMPRAMWDAITSAHTSDTPE